MHKKAKGRKHETQSTEQGITNQLIYNHRININMLL